VDLVRVGGQGRTVGWAGWSGCSGPLAHADGGLAQDGAGGGCGA